ncbi:Hypothetical predicted protein [Cloeon dipterum]|uniref:Uncharacterized protein n=1 Tax=Cloeon dipterum TaxID=197152 RepID=A0A8S1CWZ0_9INSE|nr:Hypothetical predicted protein [Cloeon dipterum]
MEDRIPIPDQITPNGSPQDGTKQVAGETISKTEDSKCTEENKSSGKESPPNDCPAEKTELKSASEEITPKYSAQSGGMIETVSESSLPLDQGKLKNVDLKDEEENQSTLQVKSPWVVTNATPFLREYFQLRGNSFVKEMGKCRILLIFSDFTKTFEPWKVHFVSASTFKSSGKVGIKLFNEYGAFSATSDEDRAIGALHVQEKDGVHLISVVAKEKSKWYLGKDPEKTLANMVVAMESLKKFCVENNIKRIAMERFFANHERVNWRWTQQKMLEIFADTEILLAIYKPTCFWNKYRDMKQLVKNLEAKITPHQTM